jgi:conjugal transfer pilus assembly protein TraL
MTEEKIPATLDDLPKLIFWEIDVALAFLVPTGLGMFGGNMLLGLVFGVGAGVAYSKAKAGKARGYARHLMYWHLPVGLGFQSTPPSHLREFVG